ncbi:MAG TPA: hypothetical protein QF924_20050, partial [Pseudomonadales bacterium]|nr:hypothetical protein [Pseudomonadales bacterium]
MTNVIRNNLNAKLTRLRGDLVASNQRSNTFISLESYPQPMKLLRQKQMAQRRIVISQPT